MLVVAMVGVGCGGDTATTTTGASTDTTAASTETTVAATGTSTGDTTDPSLGKVEAKFGTAQPVEASITKIADAFAKEVSDRTGGQFVINVFPAQQLGTANDMIQNTQAGAQDMVLAATGNYTSFLPAMGIPGLPYLITTPESANAALYGAPGQELLDAMSAKGMKGLAFWLSGFTQTTGNFPITQASDLKGKKMRVLENPILVAQYKALGATPVAINFGELYNALQQGVVDGQENPMDGTFATKLQEVQKYMALTNHSAFSTTLVANQAWFDKLSPAYQQVLVETAQKYGSIYFETNSGLEKSVFIPAFEKAGMKVTALTDEQNKTFEDVAAGPAEEALRGMLDPAGATILQDFKAAAGK